MYTPEEIAQKIDQNKLDFKEFKELFDNKITRELIENIKKTKDPFETLLKAEITAMFFQTHSRRYIDNIRDKEWVYEILEKNIVSSTKNSWYPYQVSEYFKIPSNFITGFMQNHKTILPVYLYKKLNPSVSITETKTLKDDMFSFNIFKNYVSTLSKGIKPIEVENYLFQVQEFKLKESYIEVLLDNCFKPSIKLQKRLSNKYYMTNLNSNKGIRKYMYLPKPYSYSGIGSLTRVIGGSSLFDNVESTYKPFITNLTNRTIETEVFQLEYLIDHLTKLRVEVQIKPSEVTQYFIESLENYLAMPEHAEIINKELERYQLQMNAYTDIIKNLKSGHE